YVVAEASVAYKRAGGPWDRGHRQTLAALDQAARVITLNPKDAERLPDPEKTRMLAPFLDAARFAQPREARNAPPVLVATAMMRPGDKLASYRLLAEALLQVADLDWSLLILGDGPARGAVETAFAALGGRVEFRGTVGEAALPEILAGCDLCVWPAINEAYGMALLEAEAAGLPVVAGRSLGVPAVVAEGETGLLVPPGDAAAFAQAVRALLSDPERCRRLGRAAARKVRRDHDLAAAARTLDSILQDLKGAS
ncbi:MAG: glycosyltransferase family 4 protein, partial [Rhodovibrionaceae bacterium]